MLNYRNYYSTLFSVVLSPRLENSVLVECLRSQSNLSEASEVGAASSSLHPRPSKLERRSRQQPMSSQRQSPTAYSPPSSMSGSLRVPTDSPNTSSSVDIISQLEARLASLQKELLRNERLLSRIDAQKKMANRDRLKRLENTLENHRKVGSLFNEMLFYLVG